MPYLLVRWVVLSIAHMKVELSILVRDPMTHGAFEGVVVDERLSSSWSFDMTFARLFSLFR